jgi:hypothetical protein
VVDDVYLYKGVSIGNYRKVINNSLLIYPTSLIDYVNILNVMRWNQAKQRYCVIDNLRKDQKIKLVSLSGKLDEISPLALALPPFAPSKLNLFEYEIVGNDIKKNNMGAWNQSPDFGFETQEVFEASEWLLETTPKWQEETWVWNAANELDLWVEFPPLPPPPPLPSVNSGVNIHAPKQKPYVLPPPPSMLSTNIHQLTQPQSLGSPWFLCLVKPQKSPHEIDNPFSLKNRTNWTPSQPDMSLD